MFSTVKIYETIINSNWFNTLKDIYINYDLLIWTVLTILFLIIIVVKFRKMVYRLMTDAETGALTSYGMVDLIDKIQNSDLDERMVLVIAKIITIIPIFRILPKSLVVKFLNHVVQKMFDNVKVLLKARADKKIAEAKLTESDINQKREVLDQYVKTLVEELLKEIVNKQISNKINEIVPKPLQNATEEIVDTISAKVPDVVEDVMAEIPKASEVIEKVTKRTRRKKEEPKENDSPEDEPDYTDLINIFNR